MRTRKIFYNSCTDNLCSSHLMGAHDNTNTEDLKHKANFLKKLIQEDLTDRQKICATEHWLNGKTQLAIAAQLGLNKSTVSRHLAAAKRKLRSAAKYLEA